MKSGQYSRDTLLKDLREHVIEVHFTKVNGEQRIMRCTLQTHLLPELYQRNLEEQREENDFHVKNPDVIAAWDVVANGWRSFRIDSVLYVQIIDNY
jgi:hypothetical protein